MVFRAPLNLDPEIRTASSSSPESRLQALDSLTVDVITDNVSDAYVSKTLFALSEFSNVILGGAQIIPAKRCYALTSPSGSGLDRKSEEPSIPSYSIPALKALFSNAIARISESII